MGQERFGDMPEMSVEPSVVPEGGDADDVAGLGRP